MIVMSVSEMENNAASFQLAEDNCRSFEVSMSISQNGLCLGLAEPHHSPTNCMSDIQDCRGLASIPFLPSYPVLILVLAGHGPGGTLPDTTVEYDCKVRAAQSQTKVLRQTNHPILAYTKGAHIHALPSCISTLAMACLSGMMWHMSILFSVSGPVELQVMSTEQPVTIVLCDSCFIACWHQCWHPL